MVRIAQVELVPPRDEPSPAQPEKASDADVETFDEPPCADHKFRDDIAVPAFLGAKFLEPPDSLPVRGDYPPSEKPIEPQLAAVHVVARVL
jgi:hypothetical protein